MHQLFITAIINQSPNNKSANRHPIVQQPVNQSNIGQSSNSQVAINRQPYIKQWINQSVNHQSTSHQSINQSVILSSMQSPISRSQNYQDSNIPSSINQPSPQSVIKYVSNRLIVSRTIDHHLTDQQPINQSINSYNKSVNGRPIKHRPNNQSLNQSITNKPINHQTINRPWI